MRLLLTTRHRRLLIATGDDTEPELAEDPAPTVATQIGSSLDAAPTGYDENYYYPTDQVGFRRRP
jgi:hypothetical protein